MLGTEFEDWLPNELAPELKADPELADDDPELTVEDAELKAVDEPELKVDPELMVDKEFNLVDCEFVLDPKIPAFKVAPKIFVASEVTVWKTQTPLAKVNPFPHLRHLKSGVKVTQFKGMFLANPNKFSKYIIPVFPTSKVAMLALEEAADEAALFAL